MILTILYDTSKYTGFEVKILSAKKVLSLMSKGFNFTNLKTGVDNIVSITLQLYDKENQL